MCMITATPAHVEIPVDGIRNGSITNDDGHGWAVASEQYGLQVGKSMDFNEALEGYVKARDEHGMESIGLFHSRFGTHGEYGEYNIHPFYASETTVVAHNGILPSHWHPKGLDRRSDTRIFVDRVLPAYVQGKSGVPSRRGAGRLGEMIGSGNKLAFLSVAAGKPRLRIVNAWVGTHSQGSWFSNTGFEERKWTTRYWNPTRYSNYESSYGYTFGRSGSACSTSSVSNDGKRLVTTTRDASLFEEESYYLHQCETCAEFGTVNINTDVCSNCGVCQSCWDSEENCECAWNAYLRKKKQEAEEAERDGATILALSPPEPVDAITPATSMFGIDSNLWDKD